MSAFRTQRELVARDGGLSWKDAPVCVIATFGLLAVMKGCGKFERPANLAVTFLRLFTNTPAGRLLPRDAKS